jgi:hypothetical protein
MPPKEDDPARGRRQAAMHGIVGLRATANLQAFFQAFPNFGLFSPRISKEFLWRFRGISNGCDG